MMDGIKVVGVGVGGGGGRVGVGEEDMGDGMQCSDHPYRNNPGGICAFCLQEKLGKLVSSSFPLAIRGSSSSSSSPSFRSDIGAAGSSNVAAAVAGTALSSVAVRPTSGSTKGRNDGGNINSHYHHQQEYYTRRARIPFLLAKKKKKMMVASSSSDRDIVFKRSKSTTTPGRRFLFDSATDDGEDFSPRKRGFWSFLYLSSGSKPSSTGRKPEKMSPLTVTSSTTTTHGSLLRPKENCMASSSLTKKGDIVVEEDEDSPNSSQATASASSFERKVSRSRSVGCGSRSFSGDFFERISTGFGDCTLRRVESQREGKSKVSATTSSNMKERVKCGGIFGGFIITSSSSSSSSSSYWVSSSAEDHMNGKSSSSSSAVAAVAGGGGGPLAHGRSKSWGWAFASPMRAFSKPSSKDGKRSVIIREASSKNTTPNLSAIPSLLAVRG